MSDKDSLSGWRFWLGVLITGLVSGLVTAGTVIWATGSFSTKLPLQNQESMVQPTPALALLDTLRCPRGLTHSVQVRGVEDNFSRLGDEPARIDPSLLRFGSFRDAQEGRLRALGLRDYDEGGADKQLIDYFDVPPNAVSGTLVVKLKTAGSGNENDFIRLVPSQTFRTPSGAEKLASFAVPVTKAVSASAQAGLGNVVSIPLYALTQDGAYGQTSDIAPVLAYVAGQKEERQKLTLMVSDDTAVDLAALSLCSEPELIQGVTFSETSDKPLGPDYSILSCAGDDTQSHCGPYSGDTLCSTALPVACYKDGTNPKPPGEPVPGVNLAAFVGGTVRPSTPVPAAQFPTRQDADSFCAREFGAGYRVLSYQEGGGGTVVSASQIPAKMRLWIDIRDQPRGRCWDRPPGRQIPSSN